MYFLNTKSSMAGKTLSKTVYLRNFFRKICLNSIKILRRDKQIFTCDLYFKDNFFKALLKFILFGAHWKLISFIKKSNEKVKIFAEDLKKIFQVKDLEIFSVTNKRYMIRKMKKLVIKKLKILRKYFP